MGDGPLGAVIGVLGGGAVAGDPGYKLGFGITSGLLLGAVAGGVGAHFIEDGRIGLPLVIGATALGSWLGYELAYDDTSISVGPTDGGASVSLRGTW